MKLIIALIIFIILSSIGLYYVHDKMQQEEQAQQQRTEQLINEHKQAVQQQRQNLGKLPDHIAEVRTEAPRVKQVVRPHLESTKKTYICDGRTYCTQMHSLEEARWFLRNCPNTKMDGDHDGEPCESDSRFH